MIISKNELEAAARDAARQQQYHRLITQRRRDRTQDDAETDAPIPEKNMTNQSTMHSNETTSNSPTAPDRDQLIAEFSRDPALQREFLTADIFVAFRRAEARGAFKLLRRD